MIENCLCGSNAQLERREDGSQGGGYYHLHIECSKCDLSIKSTLGPSTQTDDEFMREVINKWNILIRRIK